MNVMLLSPGYPADMPEFVRGLAEHGARVFGVGDQPFGSLPDIVRRSLSHYVQVRSLWDTKQVIADVHEELRGRNLDRIECLWEPGIMLAAELRQYFGVDGLSIEKAHCFRDKEAMKRVLDEADVRTPHHVAADSIAAVWEAVQEIGFPVILKPVAGAGSADTYRIDAIDDLRAVLPRLRHVPMVSVEEFVDGEEYTFDTITINGRIAYYNIAWYRPRPLIARSNEWISPQVIALRSVDQPEFEDGVRMGNEVIAALGFDTGFTHMEWFLTASGEAVFGEIAARPPGAHSVDLMNFACDLDTFSGWAEAVCHGRFTQPIERRYNAAVIFKRAQGPGTHISRIEGLEPLLAEYGALMPVIDLVPVGAARRDPSQVVTGDGWIVARHPDLATTLHIADRLVSEVRVLAD